MIWLIASFVVLLVIGVPVATTLGLSSVIFIILEGIPTSTVIQRMFAGVDVVALLCIPFFILAGDLMAKGGIAKRLVRVANLVVGNITGGLRNHHCLRPVCRHDRFRHGLLRHRGRHYDPLHGRSRL